MVAGGAVYSLTEEAPGFVSPMKDPDAFYRLGGGWVKGLVHANERVGLAVSGGIDSTVVARMLRDSIGENVHVVHMDHGFMRNFDGMEESDAVVAGFSGFPHIAYRNDVRDRFYRAVAGIEDGDKKRAAFRGVYKDVLNETMEPLGCVWTADGTIKPDIRETRGGIKLQHNVDLGFAQRKLEPLAGLSKQEVRALARYLGIPHLRQPFPGPGLLLRTVGVYSPEKLAVEKRANDIVEQEYRKFMLDHFGKEMVIDGETGLQIPFQTFAATFDFASTAIDRNQHGCAGLYGYYLNTKTTGLVDDGRNYARVYKRPFVVTDNFHKLGIDYMNCDNNGGSVSSLVKLTDASRLLLQLQADDKSGSGFAVAIRAIDSIDVGKAVPNISGYVPYRAARRMLDEVPDVRCVLFDVTPKPPATVEYE